jgi:hypothetical protein
MLSFLLLCSRLLEMAWLWMVYRCITTKTEAVPGESRYFLGAFIVNASAVIICLLLFSNILLNVFQSTWFTDSYPTCLDDHFSPRSPLSALFLPPGSPWRCTYVPEYPDAVLSGAVWCCAFLVCIACPVVILKKLFTFSRIRYRKPN